MIKLLDCTLRDGGYINNWIFGKKNIDKIINNLIESNIDIIEVGFLDESIEYDENITLFNNLKDIDNIIRRESNYVAMIMHEKYDVHSLPLRSNTKLNGIRYCFKKNQIDNVIDNLKIIQDKGYDLYLQPASLTDYTKNDIEYLIDKVKKIKIKAFYIVDTYGLMQKDDVLKYYKIIDSKLYKEIPIGFHSHNNLQLSFSNSQELLNLDNLKRDLYIDSSVFGMGRGAGNLCSELICKYLNTNYNKDYDLVPILELIDECINPIFKNTPWGYSIAYYCASINSCHPNYSTYLVNKQTIGVKDINSLLKKIPSDKKRNYDEILISKLYKEYLGNKYNDTNDKKDLYNLIKDKNVLIICPGSSILKNKEEIDTYIRKNNPYIISLNFLPENFKVNSIFVSNLQRYKMMEEKLDESISILYTSNLLIKNINSYKFDYSSYLNDDLLIMDNSGIMFLKILSQIGIKKVSIAGFDGYNLNTENYFSHSYTQNIENEKLLEMSEKIREEINKMKKKLKIEFITNSIYDRSE